MPLEFSVGTRISLDSQRMGSQTICPDDQTCSSPFSWVPQTNNSSRNVEDPQLTRRKEQHELVLAIKAAENLIKKKRRKLEKKRKTVEEEKKKLQV